MDSYGLLWPKQEVDPDNPPPDGQIFDVIEFTYEYVAAAMNPTFHSYMSHTHYAYDQETGRDKFAQDVNRIFERNGVAFALVEGEVTRLAPAVIDDLLAQTIFRTGDADLDAMLEAARQKFLNRALDVRRESLEKLWDAWERLKTFEGSDKKKSIGVLLQKACAEPKLRDTLEEEAKCLTRIGNEFMIRHHETDKTPISADEHVDYLFHRLFALISLLLRSTSRGG